MIPLKRKGHNYFTLSTGPGNIEVLRYIKRDKKKRRNYNVFEFTEDDLLNHINTISKCMKLMQSEHQKHGSNIRKLLKKPPTDESDRLKTLLKIMGLKDQKD